MEQSNDNERVLLMRQMIKKDPSFWPYPIPRNFNLHLLEIRRGFVKLETKVQADWLNPLKIMHGGILITLMDEAMGFCGYTLDNGQRYATINLNAEFFASAKENETIVITATIEKEGRQLIHAIADIKNEKGRILTKSSSNLLALPAK